MPYSTSPHPCAPPTVSQNIVSPCSTISPGGGQQPSHTGVHHRRNNASHCQAPPRERRAQEHRKLEDHRSALKAVVDATVTQRPRRLVTKNPKIIGLTRWTPALLQRHKKHTNRYHTAVCVVLLVAHKSRLVDISWSRPSGPATLKLGCFHGDHNPTTNKNQLLFVSYHAPRLTPTRPTLAQLNATKPNPNTTNPNIIYPKTINPRTNQT